MKKVTYKHYTHLHIYSIYYVYIISVFLQESLSIYLSISHEIKPQDKKFSHKKFSHNS